MSYSSGVEGGSSSQTVKLVLAWCFVGIPLVWGVVETVQNALQLFK